MLRVALRMSKTTGRRRLDTWPVNFLRFPYRCRNVNATVTSVLQFYYYHSDYAARFKGSSTLWFSPIIDIIVNVLAYSVAKIGRANSCRPSNAR